MYTTLNTDVHPITCSSINYSHISKRCMIVKIKLSFIREFWCLNFRSSFPRCNFTYS